MTSDGLWSRPTMHSPPSRPSRFNGHSLESIPVPAAVPARHQQQDLDEPTASLLRRIPPEIAKDIIKVPPGQSFQDVEFERERRLRLLIRRYVNQLLYGCVNRNCTTSTCLSFRKRHSKGPIRLYTELSARSLAYHLIQEYAKAGKDPKVGLCQNQPVVPWYSMPGSSRNSKQDLAANATNGHVPEPQPECQARFSRSGLLKQPPTDLNESSAVEKRCETTESVKDEPGPPEVGPDASIATASASASVPVLPKANDQDVDPDTEPGLCRPRYDYASFPQTLITTTPLRELETPLSLALKDVRKPGSGNANAVRDRANPIWHNTAFCGLAFRRLEWKAVLWLQNAKSQGAGKASPFQIFVCNSLLYTLTNPRRLCESAMTWRTLASSDAPSKGSSLSTSTSPSASQNGRTRQPSPDRPAVFDLDSSLRIFHTILNLSPEPNRIWSDLRLAVQQSYASAPSRPLAKTRDRMLQSSVLSPSTHLDKGKTSESLAIIMVAMISPLLYKSHGQWRIERPGDVKRSRNFDRADLETESESAAESEYVPTVLASCDVLDDWQFLDLSTSLMDCLSHQLAVDAIRDTRYAAKKTKKHSSIVDKMLDHMAASFTASSANRDQSALRSVTGQAILEMARNAFVHSWDQSPVVKRTSSVGGALQLMHRLHHWRDRFGLSAESFEMALVSNAITDMEMPSQWVVFEPSGAEMHILSFAFLFDTRTLVKYFRTINITAMRRSYEAAAAVHCDARQFLRYGPIPIFGSKEVLAGMRSHMAKYFVLTVRRSHLLEDAISQIWRRQRQEVLRPLRIRLGKDEGEDGLDHGGVQQEFFRLVFAEAFDPDRGMFTVDERSYAWFQPGSYEPLYKFEAVGILMSLAVYNSIALPITMPRAFYRKLLGLKVKRVEDIKDGWPDLARGLQNLLDFDGDVAEVIARTYEFSYDFAGTTRSIDMQKDMQKEMGKSTRAPLRLNKGSKDKVKSTSFELPVQLDLTPPLQSPVTEGGRHDLSKMPSMKGGISTPLSLESELMMMSTSEEEAAVVTNENREQYVKDYIHYLTDRTIRPQWEAFSKGFFTCIDRKSLTLFTPEQLALVVEGHRSVDIDELEKAVSYEDYDKNSPYIRDFWDVVRNFTPDQHRQLLEFVTASDRVPITGEASLNFTIQRQWEDSHLPSSSTCYHRLLLPQYPSKEILARNLAKALEHSVGFGTI